MRSEYGLDKVVVGEDYLLHYARGEKFDGTSRLLICTHGHNGTASQWVQAHNSLGRHAAALVRTGRYIALSVSASGGKAWSDPAALASVNAGVAYARTRGARAGKYGLMGYSMGGLTAMNQIKRDASNISGALLWAPLLDLNWAHTTNASYATEIDAAFGTFAASVGYRVSDEPATFASLQVPVKMIHATDDATVPYSQTTSFLTAINNPLMTVRKPDVVGDHTGMFQNTPDQETVDFFDSLSW